MTKTIHLLNRSRSLLASRIPTTPGAVAVVVGDLVALFAFIAVGQHSHGYLFWQYPTRTVLVFSPFLVTWLLVSSLAGLASESSLRSYRTAIGTVFAVWVVAALLSGMVRRTAFIPGNAPPSFLAVSIIFGFLFLAAWRVTVATLLRR